MISQKDIENKWQAYWKEKKTFEPKLSDQEKFFFTVPYPYANSALHIGHGRTYTVGDIISRYQRLKGKNVLYPLGFHISGTPVLAVADAIARGDEKQTRLTKEAIAEYVSDEAEQEQLLKSFSDPFAIANFFSSRIEETLDSIGMSIDWSRQFSTGDEGYKKFVQWQYKKLKEKGILVQGKYPILYSLDDENAVGEDDIKDGDTDKVLIQDMKYIKFKLTDGKDDSEFLVAATLRPDSLFGATNLYVKPDMVLVRAQVGDEIWVVSKIAYQKIAHQMDDVSLLSEHTGKEFIDKNVIVPLIDKEVPVYPMDYPDENHGTGIVYSSPADSPHDYIYLFELLFPGKKLNEFTQDPLKLSPITQTKDKKGNLISYKSNIPAFDTLLKFNIHQVEGNYDTLERAKEALYKEAHYGAVMINCGEFDGTPLKGDRGAQAVLKKLETEKKGGIFYETSRRAVTRSGSPVIVGNLDGQWFLDYSADDVKEKVYTLLSDMTYFPQQLRDTQKGYLTWVQKRPCARKRGIGTPLPDDDSWVIEPLSDSTIYQLFYHVMKHVNAGNISVSDLTDDFFNYVFLLTDVCPDGENVAHYSEVRKEIEYWKAFDMRYSNAPHMSNHLSFLLYHYALLFAKELQPKNITIGGLMIKDGQKISKSKGNGIPLIQVKEKYGVDLYRLYCGVGASYETEMDFRDDEIHQLQKKFEQWKSFVYEAKGREPKEDLMQIDTWLISQFYTRAKAFFTHFDQLKFREAYVQILYEFLNDIIYHERRTNRENTLSVLAHIYQDYALLMTPVIPHSTEEILDGKASLTPFVTDPNSFIDEHVIGVESIGQTVISSIAQMQNKKGMKELKSITLVQATDDRFALFDTLSDLLGQTREFKTIMQTLQKDFASEGKFIQKFVPKTLSDGLHTYLPKAEETAYLTDLIDYLVELYGCDVEIVSATPDHPRAGSALPGRPSILLE